MPSCGQLELRLALQDAQHDLLAVLRRQHRGAHVDRRGRRCRRRTIRPAASASRRCRAAPSPSRARRRAFCRRLSIGASSRSTPSTRKRTSTSRGCGLRWMSEARALTARPIRSLTRSSAPSGDRLVVDCRPIRSDVADGDRRGGSCARSSRRARRRAATAKVQLTPSASRSSSVVFRSLGSATATCTVLPSRKRTGSA